MATALQVNDYVVPIMGLYKGSPARVVDVIDVMPKSVLGKYVVAFTSGYRVRYNDNELKKIEGDI